MTTIVMLSFWRNDSQRQLAERAAHLLSKTYPALRYVWVIGDSTDGTEDFLRAIARDSGRDVTIVRHDTGILGTDPRIRLRTLSQTLTAGLATLRPTDTACVLHESDLQTPPDVIERFLATGCEVVGGWPTLTVGGDTVFYDTWAYRAGGNKFTNRPPYHRVYRADAPFKLDSVGSCWMFPAIAAHGLTIERWACVELCARIRERGYTVWCDPTVPVVQPAELWHSQPHAVED